MYSELAKPSEAPAGADSDGDDPSSPGGGAHPQGAPDRVVESAEEPASPEFAAFAGTPAALLPALRRRGFEQLTEVQRAIAAADDGARDLRITSQTGSGKTVALGFSLLAGLDDAARVGPTTLVIAPTRELAMQVKEELAWLFADVPGVRCEVVTGGTSISRERMRLKRRPNVVVGTPGRLLDHLRERALDVSSVSQLVLDEADQMLDLGFKDELDGILEQIPEKRRTHLVSATFPRAVADLADRFQREPILIEGSEPDTAHADIEHIAYRIGSREHYGALVNLLLLAGDERTLVFVRTREDTVTLADKLASDGFATMPLNGDLAQAQRTRTLESFRRGTTRALIATDVAARGLDISSVTMVVHVHPPIDSATYVHRSGRTGRAGQKGRSVMLVPKMRAARVHRLYRDAGVDPRWAPIPGVADVQNRQVERTEASVRAAIDASAGSNPALVAVAESLLQDRNPADVVALLLAQSLATTCEPFDLRPQTFAAKKHKVRDLDGATEGRSPHRGRPRSERQVDRSEPRSDSRSESRSDSRSESRGGPAPEAGFTRFRINWGYRDGADPRRILAHVCRRGGVDSKMIGAIQLHTAAATFHVANAVAASFARRVQRRDRRDPHLFIVPDAGGHRGQRGPSGSRGPFGSRGKHGRPRRFADRNA